MINHTILLAADSIPLIEWLAPALMAAGLVLLIVIAVLLARRPRAAPPHSAGTDALRAPDLFELRQELQDEHQRVAELIGVAQRLASKSDDKAALLNQLITQADERLASLQRAISLDEAESLADKRDHSQTSPTNEVELVISRKITGRQAGV